MPSLALLPASTVHRIASSQVITSISTAVKELVENSLDAGADNIEVKLEDYGFSRIEVRDNGRGVKPVDVAYMAQRHYTSKINSFENLSELTTYGFRGEALCSLCSVGSVAITTKTKDSAVAQCFTLGQAGKILSTKPTSLSTGTTVVVNNLFKNLPVRKQFLSSPKKCKEELKKVEELVMAFGCVHPGIRIVLWHNKSIIWQKSKVSDHKTALMTVLGTSVMAHMEKIDYKDEEYKFEILGYLPKLGSDPNVTCRTNNDRGFIFINDRPVVMKEVSKLVRQYYSQAGQKFPVMFLKIKLPPDGVDVNLEPNKTRVLLIEKEHILEALKNVLAEFYGQETPNNLLVPDDNEHCKALNEKGNENKMDMLVNDSDLQIDEMFTPIASSTLNSTACENLQNENPSKTNMEKVTTVVNQSRSVESNLNVSLSESISVNEKTDIISKQPDNNTHKSDRISNSEMSSAVSTLVNDSKCNEVRKQDATEKNPVAKDLADNTSTDIHSSLTAHYVSEDKDSNKKDKLNYSFSTSNSAGCTGDLNNVDLSLELTENSKTNGKANSELSKEDIDNIQKLLDLTEDSQQVTDLKEKEGTQQTQICNPQTLNHSRTPSENKSSVDFDDVLDDDLEFDQILKDITEKKKLSQSTQVSVPSSQVIPAKGNVSCDSPQDICDKVSERSWSTGNVLKDKQGNLTEPVRLLAPPASTKHKTTPVLGKRKHSSDKEKRPQSNKKIQHFPQVLNQSLITFHASQSPRERLKEAQKVDVSFSMLNLKKSYRAKCILGIRQYSPLSKHHLIGWLESSGVWLILQGTAILYVNHCRIQEQILYHRLIQTHVLPREKLERSIQLNPSIVGGDECWDILINLESQCEFLDSTRFIIDERIKSNGFDIRVKVDPDTHEQRVDVLSISTSLPFYGIPDLTEILGLIKTKSVSTCSLADCRPLKVVNYLKGEAVRICRAQNPRITKDDMEALLLQMEEFLPKDIRSCLHEHPFFGQIADIASHL